MYICLHTGVIFVFKLMVNWFHQWWLLGSIAKGYSTILGKVLSWLRHLLLDKVFSVVQKLEWTLCIVSFHYRSTLYWGNEFGPPPPFFVEHPRTTEPSLPGQEGPKLYPPPWTLVIFNILMNYFSFIFPDICEVSSP